MLQLENFKNGLFKMVKLGSRKYKSGENFFITIPKTIIEALGWERGVDLLVTKIEDKVIVEKIEKNE